MNRLNLTAKRPSSREASPGVHREEKGEPVDSTAVFTPHAKPARSVVDHTAAEGGISFQCTYIWEAIRRATTLATEEVG